MLYLVVTAQYTLFLRPAFGILLALAHFIAMGFMLAAVIRPRKKPVDASTAVRALVLLVPVLYYLATPNGRLGSQAFNKRFTGTGNGVAARQLELTFSSDEEDTPVYPEPLDGPIKEIGQNPTILNILLNPEKYTGKEVSIIGIFLRNEEIKPHFGGRETAVYRFLVTCCVADAMPLAIAIDSGESDGFKNDQWVQVTGVFELHEIDGKSLPLLSHARLEQVEAPPFPYLF